MIQDVLLADLLTFTRDGEWGKGEPTDGFSPAYVIRGTDFERVRAGQLGTLPLRYIRTDILGRKAIVPGDTLIETAGGTKDQPTGRSVFVPKSVVEAVNLPLICASFARFLRPDPSRVDPEFLFWKLQDEYHSRRMMPYHIQHTGVARFQYTQFAKNYPLTLPSLREQRTIAASLGALDDKIELNRRMNETLEAMARALFRDWFVDFGPTRAKIAGTAPYLSPDLWSLFPDCLDDAGKPEGWEVKDFAAFSAITSGKRPIERHETETPMYCVPLIGGGGPMAYVSTPLFNEQLILTGRVGTLGKFFRMSSPCWPSDNSLVIIPNYEYLFDFIYFNLIEIDVLGLNRGSTQPLLTQGDLKKQPIISPPTRILTAFSEITVPLFLRIDRNSKESRTLAQTRDLLLPRLMSGELRVARADRAVEAAL